MGAHPTLRPHVKGKQGLRRLFLGGLQQGSSTLHLACVRKKPRQAFEGFEKERWFVQAHGGSMAIGL